MHAHVIDQSQIRQQPVGPVVSGTVTSVGTFACGQSAQGCFQISAEAGLGSFASGLAPNRPSEVA
jgi:hypothetical protein